MSAARSTARLSRLLWRMAWRALRRRAVSGCHALVVLGMRVARGWVSLTTARHG